MLLQSINSKVGPRSKFTCDSSNVAKKPFFVIELSYIRKSQNNRYWLLTMIDSFPPGCRLWKR